MHFVRRAASRAVSASPSSFIASSRTINTSSFVLRPQQQSALAQAISKRFYSEEKSTFGEAVESAKEYASEATEAVKETVAGAATAAREYAPRGFGGGDREYAPRGYGGGDRGGDRDRPSRGGFNGGGAGGFQRGSGGGRRGDRDAMGSIERPPAPPTNSIYVGNLLFDVQDTDLTREFSEFGNVQRTVIAVDDRGLSKGFGYVYFDTVEAATAAIEAKHQSIFEGRKLVVNYQIEKKNRPLMTDPSKTLFIGNIPFEMSDADLNKLFRDIKNVIDVRVAIDRRSGQPRGFAHADFVDIDSAVTARDVLNGKELYGRRLRVDYSAGSKDRRPSFDSGSSSEGEASF